MEKDNFERRVDDRTILDKFAEDFCRITEKYAKYIVCSGFVSIAHGRSRGTEDIDMIIERIPAEKFIEFHRELVGKGFMCVQSEDPMVIYNEYLSIGDSVRYVLRSEAMFPPEMEVKFSKDELDEEQLANRVKFPLTQLDIYFSSIGSNIAFKEEYLGAEKDIEDAKHLRFVYKEKINEDEIERIKKEIRRLRK